jgi:hypothetical protein
VRIRQSMLGNADSCLRRMQYSIEQPAFGWGVSRSIGTAYHAALETLYRSRMPSGVLVPSVSSSVLYRPDIQLAHLQLVAYETFDAEVEAAGDSFIWDPDKAGNRDEAIQKIDLMVTEYWNGRWEWPEDWQVLGVEVSFEQPWDYGHTRTGTADLVMLDPNGWLVVDDHKTAGKKWARGKEHARKSNQAAWYVPAMRELFPGHAGYRFVFSVMTYKGEFERRISDPERRHEEATAAKALQVVALYEGMRANGLDLPANPASTLCSPKYCDFFAVCPHGLSLE